MNKAPQIPFSSLFVQSPLLLFIHFLSFHRAHIFVVNVCSSPQKHEHSVCVSTLASSDQGGLKQKRKKKKRESSIAKTNNVEQKRRSRESQRRKTASSSSP